MAAGTAFYEGSYVQVSHLKCHNHCPKMSNIITLLDTSEHLVKKTDSCYDSFIKPYNNVTSSTIGRWIKSSNTLVSTPNCSLLTVLDV